MTQNKKKGIAKKALSISLVAAMLATSNVPAWASGFEAVDDGAGFTVEESELLAATTTATAASISISGTGITGTEVDLTELSTGDVTVSATVTNGDGAKYYAIVATKEDGTFIKCSTNATPAATAADITFSKAELTAGDNIKLAVYESDTEITAVPSAGQVGDTVTMTVVESTPPQTATNIWLPANISAVQTELNKIANWTDLTNLKGSLDVANTVKAQGTNNTNTPKLGFLQGSVSSSDGSLAPNSQIVGYWDGSSTIQQYIGLTPVIELSSTPVAGGDTALYYVAGTTAVSAVNLADSGIVKGYEFTINNVTIKDTDSKKELALASAYDISAKLYFDADRKISVSIDQNTPNMSLSVTPAAVDSKATVTITADGGNTLGLTGTYTNNTDITCVGSADLKDKVQFSTPSYLTYNPTVKVSDLLAATGEIAKNVKLDDSVKSDVDIVVYKNKDGSAKFEDTDVLTYGSVWVGVEGKSSSTTYKNVKVINPAPVQIIKKELSSLYVDQSVFENIAFDETAATLKTSIEDAMKTGKGLFYEEKDFATQADFNPYAAANATELAVEITVPTKAGQEAVISIAPKTGNKNYNGSKVIRFVPKVSKLPAKVTADYNAEMAKVRVWTYDAKDHIVNNLLNVDLDVIGRSQYKLTCNDTADGVIRNAGTYNITMEVIDGPYKGQKIEGTTVVINKAPMSIFANKVGVSSNEITYDPDMKTASDLKKILTPSFNYNGEVLRDNVDYEWAITSSNFNANQAVTVTITAKTDSNYTGSQAVAVTTIKQKDISTLNLPEIPVQKYSGIAANAWTLASFKNLKKADGSAANTYADLIVDGKDETAVDATNYTATLQGPANGIGDGKLTLKGKGNYTGIATKEFSVVANEITADIGMVTTSGFKNVINPQVYDYAKAASADGITLNFMNNPGANDFAIRNIEDGSYVNPATCDITYTANKAVGTATVEVKGKTGYTVYAKATFQIAPKQFTATDLSISFENSKDSYIYTGAEIQPKVTVKKSGNSPLADGTYVLKEGVDYKISYKNNIEVAASSDKKAPSAVITGLGNYTFVKAAADYENLAGITNTTLNTGVAKEFSIEKATISANNITAKDVVYAAGLEVAPDITVYNPNTNKALVKDTDYKIVYTDGGVNAGAATVKITFTDAGAKNYKWANGKTEMTKSFQINKKELSACTSRVIDGKVIVKDGEITVPVAEYTATKNDNGTYTVKAAEKNYTGTITVKETAVEATTLKVTDRTTSSVSLSWDKVEGAEGYTVWFRSEYDSSVSRKIVNGGDVTSWKQSGLQAGTKYFYTVKAWIKDAEGNYVFSEQSPTQRGTTKPMAAKITAASASNGKIKVTLAGKAAGAEKYSMCYANSRSAFAANNFKVGIRTSYTSRTLDKTFSKGTYYVCVKSYRDLGNGAKVYGAWSNTFKVVVK